MNVLVKLLLLPLTLSACTNMPTYVGKIPTAPVVVADATVLDEKGLLGLTTAYQALGLIIDLVPVTGHPDRARKLAAIDNAAYGALLTARSAYKTGNATSYKKALDEGNATINRGIALIRGSRPN